MFTSLSKEPYGDLLPAGHKRLRDPRRRDVLIAQNSVKTKRYGGCFPAAREWMSRGKRRQIANTTRYPGELTVRPYRALDPDQSPLLLSCAVLCGGPPHRWMQGTALRFSELGGSSNEGLQGMEGSCLLASASARLQKESIFPCFGRNWEERCSEWRIQWQPPLRSGPQEEKLDVLPLCRWEQPEKKTEKILQCY